MSPTDQVAEAMSRLDAETRALLELSSQRHISDAELADLLRLDQEEVAERRRRAQLRLRLELGDVDESPAPTARRPSRRVWAGLLALVAVAAVVVLLVALGGDDESQKSKPAAAAPEPKPNKAPGVATPAARTENGPVTTMQRLNSTHGRGTAQLRQSGGRARLRLRLSDFLTPDGGGYAVWLFNSQGDARLLYATADTTIARDLRLPGNYRRYEFLDVARAVPRLRSAHSGISLLRVRVAALSG